MKRKIRSDNLKLIEERKGMIRKNNYGSLMQVIEYNRYSDVIVKFIETNEKSIRTTWQAFLNGKVQSAYDKSTYGVGYLGEGKYKTYENEKVTLQYKVWISMIERCYSNKYHETHPTYKDCLVCKEWHNFQVFANWLNENYYKIDGERMNLDKDILVKGNKTYSPETCLFVPKRINNLFVKRDADRGDLPIGVFFQKDDKKYTASCNIGKKMVRHLGSFNTPNEAFQTYKTAKEKYIKEVAEHYKDKIPNKLFEAMINYQVEITD